MRGWEGYSLAEGSSVVTEEFLEHVAVTIWMELHLALLDNGESSVDQPPLDGQSASATRMPSVSGGRCTLTRESSTHLCLRAWCLMKPTVRGEGRTMEGTCADSASDVPDMVGPGFHQGRVLSTVTLLLIFYRFCSNFVDFRGQYGTVQGQINRLRHVDGLRPAPSLTTAGRPGRLRAIIRKKVSYADAHPWMAMLHSMR